MTSFMFGGERIGVLNMDAMRGSNHSTEARKSFEERAYTETREYAKYERYNGKFLTVYSAYCEATAEIEPVKLWRLCLTAEAYMSEKKFTFRPTNVLAVFYNSNGKFRLLWQTNHFQKREYDFLNKNEIKEFLEPLLGKMKITLGQLSCNGVPSIAWQLQTDDAIYYIPFHNSIIIEDCKNFTFEEKTLDEMKKVYKHLRFLSTGEKDSYKILCC